MSLLPLQLRPVSTSHFYISGDVTIQEGVAIAPGVLLQADPESQILIRTGACIGIGTVVHAHRGVVEVGEGANIGASVLLIGQVTIGANACIGSATTVLNSKIASGQVVPPGSLIGDASRPTPELHATDTVFYPPENPPEKKSPAESGTAPAASEVKIASTPAPPPAQAVDATAEGLNVYGQMYVNQMLVKMFPNAQTSAAKARRSLSEDPWED